MWGKRSRAGLGTEGQPWGVRGCAGRPGRPSQEAPLRGPPWRMQTLSMDLRGALTHPPKTSFLSPAHSCTRRSLANSYMRCSPAHSCMRTQAHALSAQAASLQAAPCQSFLHTSACPHTHTNSTHGRTHTYIHTHTHTEAQTYAHTYARVHTCKPVCTTGSRAHASTAPPAHPAPTTPFTRAYEEAHLMVKQGRSALGAEAAAVVLEAADDPRGALQAFCCSAAML